MANPLTPDVHWAQRSCYVPEDNCVYLTVDMQDVSMETLSITYDDKKIIIDARSSRTDRKYHVELNLYDDIYCDETKVNLTDRQLELELFKAEANSWWPHLLSDPATPPFIKRDFDRWVDKDAQDGYPDSEDEAIAHMSRTEVKMLADAALAVLPTSEELEHSESNAASGALGADDASESSDSDTDNSPNDGGPISSGNASTDKSDDEGPASGSSAPSGQETQESSSGSTHYSGNSQDTQGYQEDSSSLDVNPTDGSSHYCGNAQNIQGHQEDNSSLDVNLTDGSQTTESIAWSTMAVASDNGNEQREVPFQHRAISFETWKKRKDLSIEDRNNRHSPLMRLPTEIRNEIFRLALLPNLPNEGIAFCPRLEQCYEMEWFELVAIHNLHARNESPGCNIGSTLKEYKKDGSNTSYFMESNTKKCLAPGLLRVSRAVHREAIIMLYRSANFTFGDIHGFVALDCFLNSISTFSMEQLRKINIHVPIWFHGPTLDKLRSTWIFKSAKSFGLTAARPHKDRIRGSFEKCIRKLAKDGNLLEFNLIIAPGYLQYWTMDCHPETENMPNGKKLVYAKRLSVEDHIFKNVLPAISNLKVTVMAITVPEIESERQKRGPDSMKEYDSLYTTVQAKCEHYGFKFKRVDPTSICSFWNRWTSV